MRKMLVILIMLGLIVPLIPVHATPTHQTSLTPADLLPADTYFYADITTDLPDTLDTLNNAFLPDQLALPEIPNLLAEIAPWIGERLSLAAFPIEDEILPVFALYLQVEDETGADAFIETLPGDWRVETDGDLQLWKLQGSNTAPLILRLPGYLVISSRSGVRDLITAWETGDNLAAKAEFQRLETSFSADPTLWFYSGLGDFGMALAVKDDQISLDLAMMNEMLAVEEAAPLDFAAVEGIPTGALLVDTGTGSSQNIEAGINRLSEMLSMIDDVDLAVALDELTEMLLGVTTSENLLPLIEGEYAAYMGYGRGSIYEAVNLPIETGVILAPENPAAGISTALLLTTFLRDEYGLTITSPTPTSFSVDLPDSLLPNLVYGLADQRVYLSTVSGAERTVEALEARNLTTDPRWMRVVAAAPENTQHIRYINLSGFLGVVQRFMDATPELETQIGNDILAYLTRYESAAIFSQQDTDGLMLTRLVLLFGS